MPPAKSDRVPPKAIAQFMKDTLQDPQLPRPNPTEAFWQLPTSAISNHQSAVLQKSTTYAIIGSGVTGCSVAKNLLEHLNPDSEATVTVLEARTLTSGATGRNGGHLLSPLPEEFSRLEGVFGRDETISIANFANRTLDSMHQLANGGGPELAEAAEARKVRSVVGYYDRDVFESTKKSLERYEECLPQFKGDHEVYTPAEGLERFNMKDTVGVIVNSAGAFWPYRLITSVFTQMLKDHRGRLVLETETPVSSVEYNDRDKDYPYTLHTARGNVRASQVIYCTNGWSGHLLPMMRGKIFPLRGTMSVQEAGSSFPHEGDKKSWSTLSRQIYDPSDETFSYGLYYITQNAATGDIFIGGEKQRLDELLSSDDTTMSEISKTTLESILPTIFAKGWAENEKPNVRKIWSGIMGFTPDHLPWVGQIPRSVTGRGDRGEWIAAGFNGYGMPLCWGCGEAVAKMILGKEAEVNTWLPKSFLISNARLDSPYSTPEAAVAGILDQPLDWLTTGRLVCQSLSAKAYRTLFGWLT